MSSKTSFFVIAALGISSIAYAWLGFGGQIPKDFDVFFKVVDIVKSDYVDDIPTARLLSGAVNGVLKNLDPYSQYLDEVSYEELKADTNGRFGGIGVKMGIRDGHLQVIAPLDGSPAESAGIQPGDNVIKINDQPARELTLVQSARLLRGAPGLKVKVSVLRNGQSQVLDFSIVREMINVQSVKDAKMISPGIGYVRIAIFQDNTAEQFRNVLENLKAEGLQALVIDLRNNSGGVFQSAIETCELLVPKGKLILTTKGKLPKSDRQFVSGSGRLAGLKAMAVLVNKGSASGSEIMAGALQDHGLARVFGVRTYGKGSVQTLMPLSKNTALRLTTSRYFTPKGRSIHEVGLEPDEPVEADSSKQPDLCLDRALDWFKNANA